MFCTNCGKQNSDATIFCVNCGTKLHGVKHESIQENIQEKPINENETDELSSANNKPSHVPKVLIVIAVILVGLFLLNNYMKNNLSESKAKDLIVKKFNLPQIETKKIIKQYLKSQWGDIGFFGMEKHCIVVRDDNIDVHYDAAKENLDQLVSKGLIGINESTENNDGCHYVWANVVLTEEGRKYYVSESQDAFELKTDEIDFGEITGIQIQEQQKVAYVSYTLKRGNNSPFNNENNQEQLNRSVTFSLYEDGWRINE